jgi:hypothetical protein
MLETDLPCQGSHKSALDAHGGTHDLTKLGRLPCRGRHHHHVQVPLPSPPHRPRPSSIATMQIYHPTLTLMSLLVTRRRHSSCRGLAPPWCPTVFPDRDAPPPNRRVTLRGLQTHRPYPTSMRIGLVMGRGGFWLFAVLF